MPRVVRPGTVRDVSTVLRHAAGLGVVASGGGTKLDWGAPPRRWDVTVDLSALDQIVDHAAGDMVVQVQAGVRLECLAAVLAGAGQQFAVDIPSYDDGTALGAGTVGGALAVALSGPRRLRYGSVRDLVLGVRMVRADGTVASAGGRVVKNVAGYDLGKLLCGSHGTLGLIVEAILRLHPLPAATAWIEARWSGPGPAHDAARALLDSQLAPSAVEIDQASAGGPVTVAALFEGTGSGVAARAEAAAALATAAMLDEPPSWVGCFPGGPDGTLVAVSFPPAGLAEVLDLVAAASDEAGLPAAVRGSAGPANLHLGLGPTAEPGAVATFLSRVRDGLAAHQGSAVVRHTPPAVRAAVDVWGPLHPGTLDLMRRVKSQFDPDHRLAPGRFVGGI
jgi:glycolate oxidase FAD binding subunit